MNKESYRIFRKLVNKIMTQVIKDQLVEVIKESIKAAIEKDEWFDVDTIGADIETKLGIDPDTEEIYELICEEIGKF